jgi:hypothetical protein
MCGGHAVAVHSDYGTYSGHPLDPRTTDADEGLTSLQPLGDASVLVEYDLGAFGTPCITGAYIAGEFVDSTEFSPARLSKWHAAISRELEKDREDSLHEVAQ